MQISAIFQPRPATARLYRENTLLLIVDVQERLMPAIPDAPQIEKNCALLARATAQLKIPLLITEQNPARLGSTRPAINEAAGQAASEGAGHANGEPAVHQPVGHQPVVIEKMRFSACTAKTLAAIKASERPTILLCGVEAHVCVMQTALDLREREYSVFAVRDAIASRTRENAEVGWQRMMSAGVLPTSTESAIFELLEEAGTPDFKALLPFLK